MRTTIPSRSIDPTAATVVGYGDLRRPPVRCVELCKPIDIEDLLVWTYRLQRADKVCEGDRGLFAQEASADGYQRHGTSGDGAAAMASIGQLGTRVSTSRASAGELHNDADLAHTAVMLLGEATARLMIWHARHASRPDDTDIIPPRPFPKKNDSGRIMSHYEPWDKQHRYGWWEIGWSAETATAGEVCAEYAVWRNALRALAFALSTDGTLTRHRVLPTPQAPTAPALNYRSRASARLRSPSPSSALAAV